MGIGGSLDECGRVTALGRYDILDTPSEEVFDRVTRIARRVFDVPMATMTLVDSDRQWFKSRQGIDVCGSPRGEAICDVAIREERALVVHDAMADQRFSESPLVLGEPHIRFYAGVPLRSVEGHAIGTLCVMDTRPRAFGDEDVETLADLAQIIMRELELRLLATTDGLTGALSRRAFRDVFAREILQAQRQDHDLSCVMFDIDHFKAVNDRLGHAVGDLVLKQAVVGCRDMLKGHAIGRLGGEEFVVLLPRTGSEDASAMADRLRVTLPFSTAVGLTLPMGVTASFGIASLDAEATTVDAVLRRADTALYAAKDGGRNRCVAWGRDTFDMWRQRAA